MLSGQGSALNRLSIDPSSSLRKLSYVGIQHHAISSFPRKRESRAVSGALALGARFRGHDEPAGVTYAYSTGLSIEVMGGSS